MVHEWHGGPQPDAHPLRHARAQVWKRGTRMRVDGSLMGVDDKAKSLIPSWKRGHFSLLFDGAPQPASLLLADHRKRTVVDLTQEKKKHRPEIDDEVGSAVRGSLGRTFHHSSSQGCCEGFLHRPTPDSSLQAPHAYTTGPAGYPSTKF